MRSPRARLRNQQFTVLLFQYHSFGIAAVGVKVAGVDGAETLDEFRYEGSIVARLSKPLAWLEFDRQSEDHPVSCKLGTSLSLA
ncbi:hypothetical protein [Novipirellula caenicola]|uniref:hypothetical protein n=1 Tax=Novipirellula caenicola TaxID=1536901 RepID=UPI0031EE0D28